MENTFRIETDITPGPETKIIKASEYKTLTKAQSLIDEAKEKCAEMMQKAEQHYQAEKQRGYEEGQAQSASERLTVVNDAAKNMAEFTQKMEASLGEIVQTILTRVLGSFDRQEILMQLIKNTIKDYTKSSKIRVMVKPENADYLTSQLEAYIEDHPVIEFFEVVPDYSVEDGDCVIDAQTEMIFVSLDEQLAAIQQMMQSVSSGG